MLERSVIATRLREMREQPDPAFCWDEQCDGSVRALVLFVGPSPGYNRNDSPKRRPRKRNCRNALWDKSYTDPLRWAGGFSVSFSPLVEALLLAPYAKASKLIGRANLDWFGNPKSKDVPEKFMREGAPSVLRMIADCLPELVCPMDKKTFWILQDVMEKAGFKIKECTVTEFKVRISDAAKVRLNRKIYCFRASSPKGHQMVVIKLPQHPAKMLQADYGKRCGAAVRKAAQQIASGLPVNVRVT